MLCNCNKATLDDFGRRSNTINVLPYKLSGICSWTLPSSVLATGSFFALSTLKLSVKECKTFYFSVFISIASAVAFKKET